ncbi:MAG: hypothetical protein IKJ65_10725 [Clostridia bacterium]|nr:hypothetical protein [Lentisphaeria bacterium]MBR3929462.1 hypothetical protein [Clostridia bacterium]
MKKHELSIGLNDKETKKQEIATEDALKIITTVVYDHSNGATIIPNCAGVYTHDDGTKVIENTIRCEFYGAARENVIAIAKILCKALNQETIAFSETEINADLISE